MRTSKHPLSQNDLGILLALGATMFGGWMRLLPPALSGFPINDGGLFYAMMRALREHHHHLPESVLYNGLNIPFTYPPLAFYVSSIVGSAFRIPDIEIFRWFPAIILIATIPAFFALAKTVLKSPLAAGLATIFFALIPRSIVWFIMGGGVTRSLGLLFLLLAEREIYLLFTEGTRKRLVLSAIYSALVVLTHPEAALHAMGIGIFFWLLLARNRDGFKKGVLVSLLVAGLTSIWWLPVLLTHGVTPFVSASKTGLYNVFSLLHPLFFTFTGETFATLVGVFGLVGIGIQMAKKDYFIPAWLLFHFVIELRNASNVAIIPLSMLAAITVIELILPALQGKEGIGQEDAQSHLLKSGTARGFLIFISIYMIGSMAYFGVQLSGHTVSDANREAFQWVSNNTPQESRFLIMTGEMDLFQDGVKEWFPAITGRSNSNTIQGVEWMKEIDFGDRVDSFLNLEQCIYASKPLACLDNATAGMQFNYVYISKIPFSSGLSSLSEKNPRGEKLITEMNENPLVYQPVYETDEVVIFKVNTP